MDYETKKVFLINLAVLAVEAAAIFIAADFLLKYMLPFVIGAALSAAVRRPAKVLASKTSVKASWWSLMLVILLYLLICAIAALAVWQLSVHGSRLTEYILKCVKSAEDFFASAGKQLNKLTGQLPPKMREAVDKASENAAPQLISRLTDFLAKATAAAAGALPSVLFSAVITVVASCYIALDYEHLTRFLRELLSECAYKRLVDIKAILTENILKYIMGYTLLSLLAFAELFLGFFIMRIKYAALLAAVTSLIDLLPIFGTGTVLIPWAIFSFISGNSARGSGLLILYGIIFTVRYFAEPKIVGKKVGVDPLISLIAMVIGLKIGGFAGLLLFPIGVAVVIQYYKKQIDCEHQNSEQA